MNVYQQKLLIVLLVISIAFAATLAFAVVAQAEPANTYIYVTGMSSSTVSVISPITNQKITDIKLEGMPNWVKVNPSGTMLAVSWGDPASTSYDYISLYSTIDYSLIHTINCEVVIDFTFDATGSYLYLLQNSTTNKISKIDLSTYEVVSHDLPLWYPGSICYYNNKVYAVSKLNAFIQVFDPNTLEWGAYSHSNTVIQSYNMGSTYPMLIDSTNNRIIVGNNNGTLIGFNVDTLQTDGYFDTGVGSYDILAADINSSGYIFADVYVNPSAIKVFNSSGSIVNSFTSPILALTDLKLNPYNNTMYVCGFWSNSVAVMNSVSGATIATGQIGMLPWHMSIGTQATLATTLITFYTKTAFNMLAVSDIKTTVYDNAGQMLYTGMTDDAGAVSFYMNPAIQYRILFNQSPNINQWYNVTPTASSYTVPIPFSQVVGLTKWSDTFSNAATEYQTSWSLTHDYNATTGAGWMNSTYTDITASSAGFFLYKNGSYGGTDSLIGQTLDSSAPFMANFSLTPATGGSYYIVIRSNTSDGQKNYATGLGFTFPGPKVLAGVFPSDWYFYLAWAIVLIFYSVGTVTKKGLFAIFGATAGVIFTLWGWYSLIYPDYISYPAQGFVFIIGIIVYLTERERYT